MALPVSFAEFDSFINGITIADRLDVDARQHMRIAGIKLRQPEAVRIVSIRNTKKHMLPVNRQSGFLRSPSFLLVMA